MLSTFISDTFNLAGKLVGETVHQTGSLLDSTWEATKTVAEDISNIPSAFIDGYNQELFEAKPETPTEPNASEAVKPETPAEAVKPDKVIQQAS
jgi:hypothetical protein